MLGFSWYLYSKNLRGNYTWTTVINDKKRKLQKLAKRMYTEFVLTLRGDTLEFLSSLNKKIAKIYYAKFGRTRFETS